ncbi:hypothetical protein At1D1609_43010 [Agrobacterium tumefaciens]|uniref:Uncharacterized protein n=1 Tax=Agrobacterium tumefaciens TaxID=358 RepID=A0A2L2LJ70_AGRTU|nr:hypothetical protein At1D1609_43010 [Agrobacterium tumefaciens]
MRFGLVVAGGDPTELFDPVEHPFDPITVLVSMIVASRWVFAPGAGRNNRPYAVY